MNQVIIVAPDGTIVVDREWHMVPSVGDVIASRGNRKVRIVERLYDAMVAKWYLTADWA